MNFNIIGAGRLGMSLSSALIKHGQWQLAGVCNRSMSRAQLATQQLQSGLAVATIEELPHAEVTFITTPDDNITDVTHTLASNKTLRPGDIVIHCSGVHSSVLLLPLKDLGCHVASAHPFKAFRTTLPNSEAFNECDCVVEGDEQAVKILSLLFGQLGAKVISLSAEKKHLYHAAATMASNYLVTLASSATSLLIDAGINPSQAKNMCERLIENNLQNMRESATATHALTGPLMRGDVNTIILHLNAIKNPHIEGLYRAAGLATLPLTNNSNEILTTLKSLLGEALSF